MAKTAEIIEYDKAAEAIVKKTLSKVRLSEATTTLDIDLDVLRGKLEMEVVASLMVEDIRHMIQMVEIKIEQLTTLIMRMEKENEKGYSDFFVSHGFSFTEDGSSVLHGEQPVDAIDKGRE